MLNVQISPSPLPAVLSSSNSLRDSMHCSSLSIILKNMPNNVALSIALLLGGHFDFDDRPRVSDGLICDDIIQHETRLCYSWIERHVNVI